MKPVNKNSVPEIERELLFKYKRQSETTHLKDHLEGRQELSKQSSKVFTPGFSPSKRRELNK